MPNRIIHDLNRAIAEVADLEVKIRNTKRAIKPYKTNCRSKRRLTAFLKKFEERLAYLQNFIKTNDTPDEEDEIDDTFAYRRIR